MTPQNDSTAVWVLANALDAFGVEGAITRASRAIALIRAQPSADEHHPNHNLMFLRWLRTDPTLIRNALAAASDEDRRVSLLARLAYAGATERELVNLAPDCEVIQ